MCAYSLLLPCTDASFHRSTLTLAIVSAVYYPTSKTIPGTPCYNELYRMYTNTNMTSWVDLCLIPYVNVGYGGPNKDDAYCSNCPVGPFLDYTNLVRLLAIRAIHDLNSTLLRASD